MQCSNLRRRDGAGVDKVAEDVKNLLRDGVLSRVVDKAFEDVEIVDAVKIFVYIGREAV